MKIIALSDMHGDLPELDPCDVVCICGDIVPLKIQSKMDESMYWLAHTFRPWIDSLDCKKVIMVGGNHDFIIEEAYKDLGRDFFKHLGLNKDHKIIYLQDDSYEFEGKIFYGTPWIKNLQGWAFYKKDKDLKELFSKIPYRVDVLLTHQPSDLNQMGVVLENGWNCLRDYGCNILSQEIIKKQPKWHLAGHVHSGNHEETFFKNTNMVNVSIKDEQYNVAYSPFKFEI